MVPIKGVHSIYRHQYCGSSIITPPSHRNSSPMLVSPLHSQRPHLGDASLLFEEENVRIFHSSLREVRKLAARKLNLTFRFTEENNYTIVESFLTHAFKRKRTLSATEIADRLDMDYADVREALARMIKEGKLGVK